MTKDIDTTPQLPRIWEYTDYRLWLTETFHARKAIHSWYSYGVLAQRSGFKARDYLLRVMKGDKRLSADGAERLAGALDLSAREQEYFLALVDYNQAKKDEQREAAWERLQKALGKGRHASPPRLLTSIHREVLSEWHHLALRSLLELRPSPDDEEALGKRLRPTRSAAAVRRSLKLLEQGGLIERRADGLWHATDKSLATPPEVGPPAVRQYHRECLQLASQSLESIPVEERNISGLTLGISRRTYGLLCQRLAEIHLEFSRLADLDDQADRIVHLNLALFPLSHPIPVEDPDAA